MFILEFIRKAVRSHAKRVAKILDIISDGKLSPNTLTLVGLASHIPIVALIATGHMFSAALLLIFFGLFDVLDGELARLQKRAKESGMLFDASADRIKEVLIYSSLSYYLSNNGHASWAFMAVLACGFSISVSYVKAKGEVVLASKSKELSHHQINRYFGEGIASFDIRMSIIIIGLLINQTIFVVLVITILSIITFFERLILITRKLD